MARKKKIIPKLSDEDFDAAFGRETNNSPGFGEALADNLAQQDMSAILQEKAGPDKPPLSDREKLKSYPAPQSTLDLHGKTGPEAARKTASFIRETAALKLQTVRIITGKGLHSDGPAVLPDVVEIKLTELLAAQRIFTFVWDKGEKHRSGSVIVYLP